MKEQLLKLLKLKPEATDDHVIAATTELVRQNELLRDENQLLHELNSEQPESDLAKLEKRIAQKIAQSGGALNREQALVAIQHQDEAAAKAKASKKK
ncbi:MAG: hypothetical protein WCH99_04865 [Verrucomicrobiota bacterium]